MNIIKESDFRKEIKTSPRSGYLFFGEEDYMKSYDVRFAREQICPDSTFAFFNDMKLDATDFDPQKLLDALMPMPMMTDRKLVTLTGLNFTAMKSSEVDAICEVLSTLNDYDYNMLLVVTAADGLDPGYLPKRPSATFSKLSEYLIPVQFDRSTPARLSAWVAKHFEHHGLEVSPAFCNNMITYCGRSMFSLANEIDKLSYYTLSHDKKSPTESDMKLVCTPATEYDAYAFANAIMEGRQEDALSILFDYKLRRIDPIIILSDVIRVFCDMEIVSSLVKDGKTTSDIASLTGIHEYKVGLYMRSIGRSSPERLRRAVEACVEADNALKLSPQGYTALERLICSI